MTQAKKLWEELVPVSFTSDDDCEIATTITGVGPFDDHSIGKTTWPDYPLQYVYVRNRMQQHSVQPYINFIDKLHSERVGYGWGWDRAVDFHVKLSDSRSYNRETIQGVSLDHWASLLTSLHIRFAAFNLSQFCPGGPPGPPPMLRESSLGGPFQDSSMIYTTGPSNMGIEFWGVFNYSFFSADKPVFFWGGVGQCSPTFDCRAYLSPADCSLSENKEQASKVVRSMAAANPPSNTAYATIQCDAGHFIDAIDFASFGTAAGDCETGFTSSPTCSTDIKSLVQTLCIGQTACNIPASTALFGKPCNSTTGWWTSIQATCSASPEESVEVLAV